MPCLADPTKIAQAKTLIAEGHGNAEVARRVGLHRATVGKIRQGDTAPDHRLGTQAGGAPAAVIEEPARTFAAKADGTASLSLHTDRPVKTLDDLLKVAEVDANEWEVESWECSQWTVPLKVSAGKGQADQPIITQQYRVKARLRRLSALQSGLARSLEAIHARIAARAPKYALPPLRKPRGAEEEYLAVLGLFDVHFGKLCWGPETGDNYDLKEAENVFRNAVDDLTGESAGRKVARWVLPIGNDFYHMDNAQNKTLNGTPQDVDGRYAKVIEAGEMAVIQAVERLMESAPVHVVWVPGNHDPTTSFHLARTVAAWFHKAPRVTVDCSPSPRKYLHWNGTLLGLTHGNEEKKETLPNLMATERPKEWAASTCREWLLGHEHRSRQWQTKPVDTHEGTTVRVLKSLAGTDAWHHKKGYVNVNSAAAEVYFYGKTRGYAGHAVAPARVN